MRPVIPESTDELEVSIVEIAVVPRGEPLASEMTTRVAIESGLASESIKVSQEGGHTDIAKWILIDPAEWPTVRDAIAYMVDQCK